MRILFICLILLAPIPIDTAAADDLSAGRVKSAMKKAAEYFVSISTNGGYAGIYSLDLKERYGEAFYEPAKLSEIWVQPPGTPSVGQSFLRAFRTTGDSLYLQAARDAGRALAWGQSRWGGWDHRAEVADLRPDSRKPERRETRCTFDDNITQGALDFLISLDEFVREEWLAEAINLGLQFMLKSQFDNGAWPQWYPLRGGYHDCYTFNDKAINDCISLLLKAHKTYGREEFFSGAARGGDFIILSRFSAPQAGWAQQYSRRMEPAWARSFEPPGVCSLVTARNISTLVDLYLYTKDDKYLEPVPAALSWLEKSKIGENLWARLYETGTNRPVYGDVDGKVHYTFEEISAERRTGYNWRGAFEIPGAVEYYNTVKRMGAEAYLEQRSKPLTTIERRQKLASLLPQAGQVVALLDEKGRWLRDNLIYSSLFVQNFNTLCEYLELSAAGE